MKKSCVILVLLVISIISFSQTQYNRLPYKYNAFVTKADITWASEAYDTHEFESKNNPAFDIYHYILNGQESGKLKCYVNKDFDTTEINQWKKKFIDDYYIEVKRQYNTERRKNLEASNAIEFHEIFYLQNYKLKCQVVSAGPQFKVVTSSGIYVGNAVPSFSSVNYTTSTSTNKKDKIIFLGSTEIISSDSLETMSDLKRMYGTSLPMTLWYGLSKGINKVIDLKNEQSIPAKQIMSYVIADSVAVANPVEKLTTDGVTIGEDTAASKWTPGLPVYQYFSAVTIHQDWYYNKTKDIFFTKIPKVYIHTMYFDDKEGAYKTEKRFLVNF